VLIVIKRNLVDKLGYIAEYSLAPFDYVVRILDSLLRDYRFDVLHLKHLANVFECIGGEIYVAGYVCYILFCAYG
jgi:hypothetical protein